MFWNILEYTVSNMGMMWILLWLIGFVTHIIQGDIFPTGYGDRKSRRSNHAWYG